MASTTHYKSTFTGVTAASYPSTWTLPAGTPIGTPFEVHVLERSSVAVGSGPQYTNDNATVSAVKLSPAEAGEVANITAAAFHEYLGTSFTTGSTGKVQRVVITLEMKG